MLELKASLIELPQQSLEQRAEEVSLHKAFLTDKLEDGSECAEAIPLNGGLNTQVLIQILEYTRTLLTHVLAVEEGLPRRELLEIAYLDGEQALNGVAAYLVQGVRV